MAGTRYLGLDLAWRASRADFPANETCVAVVDSGGRILDAEASMPVILGWYRRPAAVGSFRFTLQHGPV
jgi:hypothetical protein